MRVTLESTSKIVTLATPDGSVPVRVWEGRTDRGVDVVAYVSEIRSLHLNQDWMLKDEQGDELAHREPSPEVLALIAPGLANG
jgi:hypothetical protein